MYLQQLEVLLSLLMILPEYSVVLKFLRPFEASPKIVVASISGRLHYVLVHILFLQAHRETCKIRCCFQISACTT